MIICEVCESNEVMETRPDPVRMELYEDIFYMDLCQDCLNDRFELLQELQAEASI